MDFYSCKIYHSALVTCWLQCKMNHSHFEWFTMFRVSTSKWIDWCRLQSDSLHLRDCLFCIIDSEQNGNWVRFKTRLFLALIVHSTFNVYLSELSEFRILQNFPFFIISKFVQMCYLLHKFHLNRTPHPFEKFHVNFHAFQTWIHWNQNWIVTIYCTLHSAHNDNLMYMKREITLSLYIFIFIFIEHHFREKAIRGFLFGADSQ